jgi:hypothetical protein
MNSYQKTMRRVRLPGTFFNRTGGQSMSKSKDLSRRVVMSGAAALPAVAALPTVADAMVDPDPIIAAYDTVLADLRAKRAELERTLRALEAARERNSKLPAKLN